MAKHTIDWANLEQVKAYATKLARRANGQNTIVKIEGSVYYVIIPTKQEYNYLRQPGVTKIWTTENFKK